MGGDGEIGRVVKKRAWIGGQGDGRGDIFVSNI